MKIGNHAEVPATAATGTPAPATASTANAPAASSTAIPAQADASAKIQLSNTAATLLKSNSTPEFDAEKVARMSHAIASGTFKVNHGAIADKLISNAQEVLGKVQS
jgi:negative regulator of flagellin synthesis FlgM